MATPPEKNYPLFPSNLPLKVEVLSSPFFLKVWLEAQPPPPMQKGGRGAHYVNHNPALLSELTEH